MASNSPSNATGPKPLRLWPGVTIVLAQWLLRFVVPRIFPESLYVGVMGGIFGGALVVLWWLLFSRAPWRERLGATVSMFAVLALAPRFLHPSIAQGGMGMLFYLYAIPGVSLAFVAWAAVSRRWATGPRWAALGVALVLACGGWTVVKTGGFTGDLVSDFSWRWAPTPEDLLVAQTRNALPLAPPAVPSQEPAQTSPTSVAEPPPPETAASDVPAAESPAAAPAVAATVAPETQPARQRVSWPGFRGAQRDGIVHGTAIATDWAVSPPVELWRRPVGPGWSSFAVDGDLLFTQEQRGDHEIVACYRLTTGEPVWVHRDETRFWESNAGAGPRGTPTLHDGRVYSLGGTGLLNVLQERDGALVWSRNVATDIGEETPTWGFSSSPLVIDDLVLVAASGRLAAYDLATGERRWTGPPGGTGYSSPQRLVLDGVEQVVQLSGDGAIGLAPADGTVLWEHKWKGYPIVQPAQTADGDLLIAVDADSGMRRLAVAHGPAGWTVAERWTSIGMKPYFNDFAVHRGHVYGFDGRMLACIDLADGRRLWKGGRYGNGQLILLADQNLLLVLSEQGELALVQATPDPFTELSRLPAIAGKTWNHPVLVDDVLLVRNGEEMVAFRLGNGTR